MLKSQSITENALSLLAPVRENLDSRVRRREDEEEVLQSMYNGLCLGSIGTGST
jgi:hypothetical protein